MSRTRGGTMAQWWGVVLIGTAAVLFFAWLGKLAGISLSTLITIGAGLAALMWMVVLVTVPWNLYFDARRIVAENRTSRERGIVIPESQDAEATTIAKWMLRFAIAGHVVTAGATAAFAYVSGSLTGYYVAAFYLLSVTLRPAGAYFGHLHERITSLTRESTHPRDDVATLSATVKTLTDDVKTLKEQLEEARKTAGDELHRVQTDLAADLAHLRRQTTADLTRVENAQAADRTAARTREDELNARIEQIARRIAATLDGISDHQELLTGMRALIRMIRSEPA